MPLPIIWGAAVIGGAALKGLSSGVKAKSNMRDAQQITDAAQEYAQESKAFIEMAQSNTKSAIEHLGMKKIDILSTSINDFVSSFEKIKNVEIKQSVGLEELSLLKTSNESFQTLRRASFEAKQIALNGLTAIGSGALLAYGTYSVVMSGLGGMIVTATTGTAIGTLSGVAATNATLAWLGGGALSVGGFGMAGGMVVLGGLVAGPALAVGGMILESQSRKALNDAHGNYEKAKVFRAQAKNIGVALKAIFTRCSQIYDLLEQLDSHFVTYINLMNETIENKGNNWKKYSDSEKNNIYICVQIAQTVKIVLDTSLLNENGELQEKSAKMIEDGNRFLVQLASIN